MNDMQPSYNDYFNDDREEDKIPGNPFKQVTDFLALLALNNLVCNILDKLLFNYYT